MDWIKVSDELPPINLDDKWERENKISKRVLVFMEGHDRGALFGQYYHNEHYPHWSCEGYMGFDQNRITYWMPIINP